MSLNFRRNHFGQLNPNRPRPRSWQPCALAIALFILFVIVTSIRARDLSSSESPSATNPGFLQVYSATEAFNDGDISFYAHSSYVIYTADRSFFKTVENHISRSDEIPETVVLPAGRYIIEARSEEEGFVRIQVVVHAGRTAVIDLEWPSNRLGRGLFLAKSSGRRMG